MNEMVCVADQATTQEAAQMVQVFTANQIHCISQKSSSRTPDLRSNGNRQVMVDQIDLEKAKRLLAEMEPYHHAPQEYAQPGRVTRRQDFIAKLGHWLSGKTD